MLTGIIIYDRTQEYTNSFIFVTICFYFALLSWQLKKRMSSAVGWEIIRQPLLSAKTRNMTDRHTLSPISIYANALHVKCQISYRLEYLTIYLDDENTDLQNTRIKTWSIDTLPTTNPTRSGRGLNWGFQDEQPATDDLRHRMALSFINHHESYKYRKHQCGQDIWNSVPQRDLMLLYMRRKNIIILEQLCVWPLRMTLRDPTHCFPFQDRFATPPNKQLWYLSHWSIPRGTMYYLNDAGWNTWANDAAAALWWQLGGRTWVATSQRFSSISFPWSAKEGQVMTPATIGTTI